jgi:acyl carrier protein
VRERVKRVMGTVFRVDPETIPDEARSEELPGWDSLQHLELMLALETEFGVAISSETMLELTTLPAIERFVEDAVGP